MENWSTHNCIAKLTNPCSGHRQLNNRDVNNASTSASPIALRRPVTGFGALPDRLTASLPPPHTSTDVSLEQLKHALVLDGNGVGIAAVHSTGHRAQS